MGYPLKIANGEAWATEVFFTHKGPAQEIRVVVGLFMGGDAGETENYEWHITQETVGEDATDTPYQVMVTGRAFINAQNLKPGIKIDTKLYILNADGSVTLHENSSTSRYQVVAPDAPAGGFTILQDNYFSLRGGWGGWEVT